MRLPFIIFVVITVSACASQQHPLTTTSADSMKERRLAVTARPPTPFFVTEPEESAATALAVALVGVAGRAAGKSDAGDRIFRENGIADPAPHLAQQLRDDLQRRYGLKLDREAIYVTDEDPKQITAAHPAADLVLDVWINNLSLEPFSQGSKKYGLKYSAYLRLIDARVVHPIDGKKGLVIARGTCSRILEETPSTPTYDDFLANGAQRLIREIDVATQFCVDEFRSTVLTAGPTP